MSRLPGSILLHPTRPPPPVVLPAAPFASLGLGGALRRASPCGLALPRVAATPIVTWENLAGEDLADGCTLQLISYRDAEEAPSSSETETEGIDRPATHTGFTSMCQLGGKGAD